MNCQPELCSKTVFLRRERGGEGGEVIVLNQGSPLIFSATNNSAKASAWLDPDVTVCLLKARPCFVDPTS